MAAPQLHSFDTARINDLRSKLSERMGTELWDGGENEDETRAAAWRAKASSALHFFIQTKRRLLFLLFFAPTTDTVLDCGICRLNAVYDFRGIPDLMIEISFIIEVVVGRCLTVRSNVRRLIDQRIDQYPHMKPDDAAELASLMTSHAPFVDLSNIFEELESYAGSWMIKTTPRAWEAFWEERSCQCTTIAWVTS